MEQNVNRRHFLGAAIGTGAAAALAPDALARGRRARAASLGGDSTVPRNRRGIQLYTMRRIMERSQADAANVLRWLGRQGYTEVETAGHYGWTAAQFRAECASAGVRPVSGHDGPGFPASAGWQDEYRTTLDYARDLGQKFTGLAWWPGPYDDLNLWHQLAEHLNEAGAIARNEFGLQFFYHNHNFEFENRQPNGEPVYNILLEETDRRLVKFELDLFWITKGGGNAVEVLSADPKRFIGYHVKDHVWGDRRKPDGSDEADWEDVGPGMLDFPDLFEAGDTGDKHYIIEHDWPLLSHPDDENAEFKTAAHGIQYLENVSW